MKEYFMEFGKNEETNSKEQKYQEYGQNINTNRYWCRIMRFLWPIKIMYEKMPNGLIDFENIESFDILN